MIPVRIVLKYLNLLLDEMFDQFGAQSWVTG